MFPKRGLSMNIKIRFVLKASSMTRKHQIAIKENEIIAIINTQSIRKEIFEYRWIFNKQKSL